MSGDEFDENGEWTGTCEKCGTNHDGYPPGTMGAERRCLRNQLVALGATAQVDQFDAWTRDRLGDAFVLSDDPHSAP